MRRSSFKLLGGCVAWIAVAVGLGGCVDVPVVDLDDVLYPGQYKEIDQNLPTAQLGKYMDESDTSYREPRNRGRVLASFLAAESGVSQANGYEAFWRMGRACAWLANHHPDLAEREKYARNGIGIGRAGVKHMSTRPEPYYYLAQCYGAFAEIKHAQGYIPSSKILVRARDSARMAYSLDKTYDYAGPSRFLGELITGASDSSTHSVGDYEEGLAYLEEAAKIAPDFGGNHLALAKAYLEDDDPALARDSATKVFQSQSPDDYSVEYRNWLSQATDILGVKSGGAADVDVSGFEQAYSTVPEEEAEVEPSAEEAEESGKGK